MKPRLLQRPAGAGVVGKGLGINTEDVGIFEHPPAELPDGLGHQAPAPVFLRQVIAQLRRVAVDISLTKSPDAADTAVLYSDSKGEGIIFIGGEHGTDVILRVPLGIGIGQAVPQVVEDLGVGQGGGQIRRVRQAPFSDRAIHGCSSGFYFFSI